MNIIDYETFSEIRLNESLSDFLNKHGIKSNSHSTGFSESEQKWFGWSHRAIYGFGIGFKIKKGTCGGEDMIKAIGGDTVKTLDDAKKVAEIFAEAVS